MAYRSDKNETSVKAAGVRRRWKATHISEAVRGGGAASLQQ